MALFYVQVIAGIYMSFRFAKIHYLILDQGKAHVQWFEHARQSYLEELGHEQELFVMDICDHILFEHIIAKVRIHETPGGSVPPGEYFYKYGYIYCCQKCS